MAGLKKSEKILVSVAGTAVVLFVFNQFVCSKEEAPPPVAKKKTVAEASVASQSEKAPNSEKESTPKRRRTGRDRVTFTTWGRDPFSEAFRLTKFDSTARDSTNFVLRGVIRRGQEAYVLIGDEILKKGEQRGDLTVLDIEKDRVVCRKKGKIVTLVLKDNNDS